MSSLTTQVDEYKIGIIGAGAVGKSSITIQYVKHQFLTDYDPTIEDSHVAKKIIDGISCSLGLLVVVICWIPLISIFFSNLCRTNRYCWSR